MAPSSPTERIPSRSRPRLPDDVLLIILSRLPTKPLRRFRCASKAWNTLITDHVSAQRTILLSEPGPLFYTVLSILLGSPRQDPVRRPINSNLTSFPFRSSHRAIHSCNGLLLLAPLPRHPRASYVVFNPTTMEYLALALPIRRKWSYSMAFLAFDPLHSPHYKVIRFGFDEEDELLTFSVEIYSSITRRWHELVFPRNHVPCIYLWGPMPVFHRGALHILVRTGHLLKFDVEQEKFDLILPPPSPSPKKNLTTSSECIGVSRGELYAAVNLSAPPLLLIWMLDDGKGKWVRKHRVNREALDWHSVICDRAPRSPSDLFPLAFHPESEMVYLVIPSIEKIVTYNPGNGVLEEVCTVSGYLGNRCQLDFIPFIPCLESINPPGCKLFNLPVDQTGV